MATLGRLPFGGLDYYLERMPFNKLLRGDLQFTTEAPYYNIIITIVKEHQKIMPQPFLMHLWAGNVYWYFRNTLHILQTCKPEPTLHLLCLGSFEGARLSPLPWNPGSKLRVLLLLVKSNCSLFKARGGRNIFLSLWSKSPAVNI